MPAPSRPAFGLLLPAFFCSGAAGLIFELLWFRQLAWVLGGTVWAATAVLAAFMAGLCGGYWLAGRFSPSATVAIRGYVLLELLVAVTGCTLVLLIPQLPQWLATLTAASDGVALPFAVALGLMLLPTTAMGMTLPLLVGAVTQVPDDTRHRLGLLYGWNTLGACVGVLGAEFLLIPQLGLAASGASAGLLCATAALLALWLLRQMPAADTPPRTNPIPADPVPTGSVAVRWTLLAAAGLSGAGILMLEIAGFRLLLLHLRGTSEAFAIMLATVLLGIGLGALPMVFGRHPRPPAAAVVAACLIMAVALPLLGFALLLPGVIDAPAVLRHWLLPLLLFLPLSMLSGWLLPALAGVMAGVMARSMVGKGAAPAGITAGLFLSNTGAAAIAAVVTGLLLLPMLGTEASLLLAAALFAAAALLLALGCASGMSHAVWWQGGSASLLLCLLTALWIGPLFWDTHARQPLSAWLADEDVQLVARREGLNETAQLLRRDYLGQPLAWRLLTNSHSMSNTDRDSRRYMKLYVWLPMLLSPDIEDALLISYGTGSTARALTDDPTPGHIDIVDPSEAVLSLSPLIHRDQDPLADPRVQVHVEDGRHYLLTTSRAYDLITGEPPPPRLAGIENLYSAEYFQLMRGRLKPAGWASYWLPVDQLSLASSRSVIAAFCLAFPDCSLWAGSNYNWMLLGSNGAKAGMQSERIARLWQGAQRGELEALGLEQPELLGAAFIADHEQLLALVGNAVPLTDNYPGRLRGDAANEQDLRDYQQWSDVGVTQQRFAESAWVARFWPPTLATASAATFPLQPVLNNDIHVRAHPWLAASLASVLIEEGRYRVPALWLLGVGLDELNISLNTAAAGQVLPPMALRDRAALALVGGRPQQALDLLRSAPDLLKTDLPLIVLAACQAGDAVLASQLAGLAEQPEAAAQLRCW